MLLTCKRIAWEAYLDRPVCLAGAQDGWLVALGITNPGLMPVRGRDFSAALASTFPGRDIHPDQPRAGDPCRENGPTAARSPDIRSTRPGW